MLDICTVTFLGHRKIPNFKKVEQLLHKYILDLIETKEYVDFLVGQNGDFDRCVSSEILKIKEKYNTHNNSHILVLPYAISENKKRYLEKYYDEIEVSSLAKEVHPKAAIDRRNQDMVDRADIVICYVTKKYGGAYKAIKYALKKEKQIINLADEEE